MTAEIADGWLPLFFSPADNHFYAEALSEGFARPGARRSFDGFDVAAVVPIVINDDVETAADAIRPMLALYAGGMGAKEANFHLNVFARMGFADACETIQDHYLNGDRKAAIAAVPTSMVEAVALVGTPDKIIDDLAAWEESVVNTLVISGPPALLEEMAAIVRG